MAKPLERVLIGDNPFIGVDHLSQDRAREKLTLLNVQKEISVLQTAFANGASGFVFSTHPAHLEAFSLLAKENPELSFELYPLLPYAQGYVRSATERGMVGMISELFGQLRWGGKVKALVGGGISTITANPYKMLETFVDMEIGRFLQVAPPKAKLKAVFLHEIIVDLALSLQLREILERYVSYINGQYHVKAGLVTRNFERLVQFFERNGMSFDNTTIMTPFNKAGFQMNPTKEACERVLAQRSDIDVIAMSILAAGMIRLDEAVGYIENLPNLTSVVVGVSSEEHAVKTFQALRARPVESRPLVAR